MYPNIKVLTQMKSNDDKEKELIDNLDLYNRTTIACIIATPVSQLIYSREERIWDIC